MPEAADSSHPLRPIATAWMGKIRKAIAHKRPWQEIAEECEAFYSAATGFLFDPKYKHKLWDPNRGEVQPRFRLTIARAFELIALFGPALYWRNPVRTAVVRELPDIPPEVLMGQITPGNPYAYQAAMAQQMYEAARQQYAQDLPARKARAELMVRYLNWTPSLLELQREAELAVTQALVTGRGVLWTLPYQPPGGRRVMVGSFFDPVENLLIDPDAESLNTAWWIAKRCVEPVWKVERDRGMPPGFLARYATSESANTQGETEADDLANHHRRSGQTQDLITYYRIWSRCGLARLKELNTELKARVEELTGDYVYLEVAPACPFPLNAATVLQEGELKEDELARAFQWPTPFWTRDRWPCQVLDFYAQPKKPWPIAPLAPGLGELKALQVLFSHLVSKIWMTQRDFIVYSKAATDEVRKILEEGRDLSFIPLDTVHKSVNEVVQFLQHPPVNRDAFSIMEYLLEMLDRRTGMTDLLYGMQKIQSRSATDVSIRQQATSVRPQYMATKVEEWQSEVARAEAFAVRWYVRGQDVLDLFGQSGAMLWDALITQTPVERTIDEIDYRIEAASTTRPNRDRDLENMQNFLNIFGPILHEHANVTGDVEPLNNLIRRWGKLAQMDVEDLMLKPRPGASPEDQQAMQQQQQAMLQQQQEMQAAAMQQQQAMQQAKVASEQAKAQMQQAQMAQAAEQHMQEMAHAQERHTMEMRNRREELALALAAAKAKLAAARQAASQKGAPSPSDRGGRR